MELFQSERRRSDGEPLGLETARQSGKWVSGLLPHLAECVDDMAFLHSMMAKSNVHGPATFMQNTGFVLPGFPAMGAWVSYGLGSMNENLPTFVVLPDSRGFAPNGPGNWSAGFLPAAHQATLIRAGSPNPIYDLFPPQSEKFITKESHAWTVLNQLKQINTEQPPRQGDSRLDARIASYELAAKLQLSAPEVMDISQEIGSHSPTLRHRRSGDIRFRTQLPRRPPHARARRAFRAGMERRRQRISTPQLGQSRRSEKRSRNMAAGMDKPAAALIKDLKSRGMLDDTIVHWTTEFGRMPCSQGSKGRDHNPFAFTSWLAGGGFKGGASLWQQATNGHTKSLNIPLTATTSMPQCCTFSESITPVSPIDITESTAA